MRIVPWSYYSTDIFNFHVTYCCVRGLLSLGVLMLMKQRLGSKTKCFLPSSPKHNVNVPLCCKRRLCSFRDVWVPFPRHSDITKRTQPDWTHFGHLKFSHVWSFYSPFRDPHFTDCQNIFFALYNWLIFLFVHNHLNTLYSLTKCGTYNEVKYIDLWF